MRAPPRRLVLLGGLLLSLVVPAAAGAQVTVRVEGDAATLLDTLAVASTGPDVAKDGGTCSGDSAAAALDRATAGAWGGTWNPGFGDWELTLVRGESHSFAGTSYWGFFLNDEPAALGICGQKLQDGDRVLFAPAPTSFDPVGLLALAGVPAHAAVGTPFTVTVTRTVTTFDPSTLVPATITAPAAGATIAVPGGGSATTGADGTVQLTLTRRGEQVLRAERSGDIRSPAVTACATDGADGFCATTQPARAGDAVVRAGHRRRGGAHRRDRRAAALPQRARSAHPARHGGRRPVRHPRRAAAPDTPPRPSLRDARRSA